ncbi:MAG TPA: CHAD domain-containing protein [Ktedonobacterales bacterium]
MEVEAKFAITGALDPASLMKLALHPYTLRSAGVERHSDTLLDTPARAITSTRHALRIRAIGERRILTLKGPSAGVGGVLEREELEAELAGPPSLDPRDWPREIGEAVAAMAQGEPLEPLLRVEVERRLWAVRRGGRVVGELALDTGEIIAAGRREPIHELELELKGSGSRADLDTLCHMLAQTLPLAPEPRSKLERGLALLRHARWTLDGYTPLDALVRHIIRRRLRDMRRAQRFALESGEPDAIHDMRVATRRIRSTLQAFEGAGVYDDTTLRSLRKRLGAVADALGVIRDLDIFLQRVRDWIGADARRDRDVEELRDLLASRRLAGYERLVERLNKRKYAKLLAELERFVTDPAQPASGEGCALTRHYVGSVLWPRYERVLRYETVIADAEPPILHQLRITCKRLRYALEIFTATLGEGVTPVRKALTSAQSRLGDVQDLTVALRLVTEMSEARPANEGLAALRKDMESERADLRARVDEAWDRLRSQDVRDALSATIAAL